jgi:hypothetical protein
LNENLSLNESERERERGLSVEFKMKRSLQGRMGGMNEKERLNLIQNMTFEVKLFTGRSMSRERERRKRKRLTDSEEVRSNCFIRSHNPYSAYNLSRKLQKASKRNN